MHVSAVHLGPTLSLPCPFSEMVVSRACLQLAGREKRQAVLLPELSFTKGSGCLKPLSVPRMESTPNNEIGCRQCKN